MSDEVFQSAVDHHRAGRLAQAEQAYRQLLAEDPEDADVNHLLGVLANQTGHKDEAAKLIERAVQLDPEYAEAHFNLGNVLADRGLPDKAADSYRRAIQLQSEYPQARINLASVLLITGHFDEAIDAINPVVRTESGYPHAHSLLADALARKGENLQAITHYARAISLQPDFAEAFNNMAQPLKKVGRIDDALAACRRAIQLRPDLAQAHSNLSSILADKGDLEGAIAACNRAIQLKPDYPEGWFNLGNSLLGVSKIDEAIAAYGRAIELKPDYSEAHDNLGNALIITGQPDLAIDSFNRAISLQPTMARAFSSLGNALKDKGEIVQAIKNYRLAVGIAPTDARVHSSLIYGLQFDPTCGPAELLAEERRWAQVHAGPLKSEWPAYINDRNPSRRLRVGYVSADFRAHPVGRFMNPLLANHNHKDFEIFCYASVRTADDLTAKAQASSDVWRDINPLTDQQAAGLIHSDQIDILIDLTMHTAKDRLLLMARKPAPVQVIYLSYPGSSGMDAFDYRITDPYLDPPGASLDYYTEQTYRLPRTYWCYEPLFPEMQVGPLPAAKNGFVSFGCLNNFCKVTPTTLSAWTGILQECPGSKLILHAAEGAHRDRLRQAFQRAGVDASRILFKGKMTVPQYMETYNEIDIALDPFPYVGGTTTCDALWMGVPVVTLAGKTAIQRGGVSVLSNSGLPDLIAQSPAQYVEIATNLAANFDYLAKLRSLIRPTMQKSPITDARQFALDMEEAYRTMWQNWCGKTI